MITKNCSLDLEELRQLLVAIDPIIYAQNLSLLSNASVGQHVRHILEFYGCVINRKVPKIISYDQRERSVSIENDPSIACRFIEGLQSRLQRITADQPLLLTSDFSFNGNQSESLSTSLYRELAYTLEHSIHHKAFIKVGLLLCGYEHLIDSYFGIAQSTIRNRQLTN
jgi:uncharacterized damage-inducible protein DinB